MTTPATPAPPVPVRVEVEHGPAAGIHRWILDISAPLQFRDRAGRANSRGGSHPFLQAVCSNLECDARALVHSHGIAKLLPKAKAAKAADKPKAAAGK